MTWTVPSNRIAVTGCTISHLTAVEMRRKRAREEQSSLSMQNHESNVKMESEADADDPVEQVACG